MTKPDDSTRFFLRVAKDTGSVRLAALCFYIAVCTRRKPNSAWRTTTAKLGAQIGVKAWQTKHLLKLASDAEALEKLGSPKLLNYRKTRRGVAVSVADKTLYDQMDTGALYQQLDTEALDTEELYLKVVGWYRPWLAKRYRSIDMAIARLSPPPGARGEKDFDGSSEPVFVPLGGHYLTTGKLMRCARG